MIINDTIFSADLFEILTELKNQLRLNNIGLLGKMIDGPNNVQVSCPYHSDGQERRPSAGIKKTDGTFHCFACHEVHTLPEVISWCFGKDDNLGSFGWKWLVKNFASVGVLERRDIKFNVDRNDNNTIHNMRSYVGEEELDKYRYYHPYWTKRGITEEWLIELFDLGYDSSSKMITFPVRDIDGNCLFVAKRSIMTKFFQYPKDVKKPLYGLYELHHYMTSDANPAWALYQFTRGDAKEIIVCESMIDCLLLWQEGYYAVALNGTGNELQMKQLQELPCRHLILATDNDEAGLNARDKIKSKVKYKIITEINFPKNIKDIGECNKEQLRNILDWESV